MFLWRDVADAGCHAIEFLELDENGTCCHENTEEMAAEGNVKIE